MSSRMIASVAALGLLVGNSVCAQTLDATQPPLTSQLKALRAAQAVNIDPTRMKAIEGVINELTKKWNNHFLIETRLWKCQEFDLQELFSVSDAAMMDSAIEAAATLPPEMINEASVVAIVQGLKAYYAGLLNTVGLSFSELATDDRSRFCSELSSRVRAYIKKSEQDDED